MHYEDLTNKANKNNAAERDIGWGPPLLLQKWKVPGDKTTNDWVLSYPGFARIAAEKYFEGVILKSVQRK